MKPILALLAVTSLLAACGDGGNDKSNDAVISTPADSVDPATVKVFTSAEVCALVSQDIASSTLGVEVSEVETSELSTPQCQYNFTAADGVRSNLTLAVQRPIEDLGGAAGPAGYAFTTSLVIFDTPYEPVDGVGDAAAVSASETLIIMAVLASNQVITIATSAPIDVANVAAFANEVVANLG